MDMLILTRRINETLVIGNSLNIEENIIIEILGIKGCQARLGITAPKEISVHREEVYKKIKKEGKSISVKKKNFIKENDNIQTSHSDYMET
jgi:carbon storage regulator